MSDPAPVAAHPAIVDALHSIPGHLLARSGSVFYSGQAAFSTSNKLYVLGLNPGGDPVTQATETIAAHRQKFVDGPVWWSEYSDERWAGAKPGAWGMQPRVLHMFASLGLDPRSVPASNVVFARTSTEAMLKNEKPDLLRACWPVHRVVIEALAVRVVVCFGGTAGRWVRDELGAHERVDGYRETNERRWMSEAHRARDSRAVVTLTHPGRANWCNAHSDPTPLVQRMLAQVTS